MLCENSLLRLDLLSTLGPRLSPGTVTAWGLCSPCCFLWLGDLENECLLSFPLPSLVVPLCLLEEGGDLLADGEGDACLEGGVGDLDLFLDLGTALCLPFGELELFRIKASLYLVNSLIFLSTSFAASSLSASLRASLSFSRAAFASFSFSLAASTFDLCLMSWRSVPL